MLTQPANSWRSIGVHNKQKTHTQVTYWVHFVQLWQRSSFSSWYNRAGSNPVVGVFPPKPPFYLPGELFCLLVSYAMSGLSLLTLCGRCRTLADRENGALSEQLLCRATTCDGSPERNKWKELAKEDKKSKIVLCVCGHHLYTLSSIEVCPTNYFSFPPIFR